MKLVGLVLTFVVLAPAPVAHLITSGRADGKQIALTFDAGADRGYAGQILRTLERNHIRASFGMTGRWAAVNPDLVRRMARDGDAFINHTYDHRSFTGLSDRAGGLNDAQRASEITRTEGVIRRLTGRSTKPFFRPPFGDYDSATLRLVARLGYADVIMWTVDSLGWERVSTSAIIQRCSTLVSPGAIVLMHVGVQSNDAHALQTLITLWRHRGYRLVTIPQLLATR